MNEPPLLSSRELITGAGAFVRAAGLFAGRAGGQLAVALDLGGATLFSQQLGTASTHGTWGDMRSGRLLHLEQAETGRDTLRRGLSMRLV